jgi:hypothetical protein
MERCKEYVARAKAINPDSEAVSSAGEGVSADRSCCPASAGDNSGGRNAWRELHLRHSPAQ